MSAILETALAYADCGLEVFPVPPGTKHSYKSKATSLEGKNWGATKNPDIIRGYWGEHPNANLGVPTGKDNGFWVLEYDTIAGGHAVDGAASLAALEAEFGPLPATRQAESPSGSVHFYFLYPGCKITGTPNLRPGIDIRGDGNMVIAPPSVKAGAGAYRWLNDLPVADAPQWLLDLLKTAKASAAAVERAPVNIPPPPPGATPVEKALHTEYHRVAQAPEGTRNHQLNTSALLLGKYVGAGELDEEKAIQTLVKACEENGSFAEDPGECYGTIDSGMRKGKADPVKTVSTMFGGVAAQAAIDAAKAAGTASPSIVPDQAPPQMISADTPVPGGANVAADEPEEEERLTQVELYEFVAYAEMHSYIHIPTRRMWPLASINSMLDSVPNGTREVENPKTGEVETKTKYMRPSEWLDKFRAVASVTWAPGYPMLMQDTITTEGGWIHAPGKATFNQYLPPTIEPKEGDASPWVDHISRVFPEEAEHLISFFAHRVQRPAEKINHGIVLGGAQGVGKDTILTPVVHAVGSWNFKEINPDQLLGQFNPFNKSVVLRINEARNLGDQTRNEFYEKTKTLTAAPPEMLPTNEKHMKEHYVTNVCAPIVTTNHLDGLFLPPDDRRWFVAWSPLRREDFTPEYWNGLYGWFANGGHEIVAWHLANRDLSGFDAKKPPTKTAAWWRMVNMSRATEDAELSDALERMGNPDAVTIPGVRCRAEPSLAEYLGDNKRNSRSFYKRFEECGYVAIDNPDATDGRWRVSGKKQVVYTKQNLTQRDQLAAARRLAMPTPHVLPPPPYS
jgi:hypothetical protein